MAVQILTPDQAADELRFGYLPLVNSKGEFVVNERGFVRVKGGPRNIVTNSVLRKDEWEELDRAVVAAQRDRLNFVTRLRARGLVRPLGSIGTLTSQWNVASEMTRAQVSLTGQGIPDQDRQDFLLKGVPVPVISKEFQIGERELQASRRLGNGLDTTYAYEASRVVAEEEERLVIDGNITIKLNNDVIYGIRTHPDINTGTAVGDFGTLSNIFDSYLDMLTAADAAGFFGPFEVWIYGTQYIEMMNVYTDGSGQSAMRRVLDSIPAIDAIHPCDWISDGQVMLVQMTQNVVDLAEYATGMVVEWSSGDGMTHFFRIMSIATPRVKSDYAGNSGIVYYTGA